MLKDLLEKFDKEFDEQFVDESGVNDRSPDDIKSLAHSHIEEAYQSNLERLIEENKDRVWVIKQGNYKGVDGWIAGQDKEGELNPNYWHSFAFGFTPTEAVENLIKELNKQ